MGKPPFLSVVVPAYNAGKTIRRCIGSVENALADIEHEVLVVDDCSRDNTASAAEKLGKRHPCVRLIRLEKNVGAGQARNAGVAEAVGEYVWFVDADDEVPVRGFSGFDAEAECGGRDLLMFSYNRVEYRSNRLRSWTGFDEKVFSARPGDCFSARDFPDAVIATHALWNKWFRREPFLGTGMLFPSELKEDFPVVVVNVYAAREIRFLDRVLYTYREDASSISRIRDDRWLGVFNSCDMAESWLERAGADVGFMTSFNVSKAHLLLLLYRNAEPEVRTRMRAGMEKYFRALDGEMFLRMTGHRFLLDEVKANLYLLRGIDPAIAGKTAKALDAATGWLKRLARWKA